jgi:hypothetical protein
VACHAESERLLVSLGRRGNRRDIFCYGEGKNDAGKTVRMCLANSGERRKLKRHAENSQNKSVKNEQHNLRSFGYGADLKTANFPMPVQIAQARARWRGLARHLDGRLAVPQVRAC